jgi:hypothetical protein
MSFRPSGISIKEEIQNPRSTQALAWPLWLGSLAGGSQLVSFYLIMLLPENLSNRSKFSYQRFRNPILSTTFAKAK